MKRAEEVAQLVCMLARIAHAPAIELVELAQLLLTQQDERNEALRDIVIELRRIGDKL